MLNKGEQVVETKAVQQEEVIGSIPKPIEAETITAPKINESERELLARCVMAEAGNQGEQGQRLVVACILNRVDSKEFPNSITEVITQQGQFSSYPKAMNKCNPTEEVYCSIEKEIVERSNTEVLYFRTEHYHDGKEDLFIEGNHYFSK